MRPLRKLKTRAGTNAEVWLILPAESAAANGYRVIGIIARPQGRYSDNARWITAWQIDGRAGDNGTSRHLADDLMLEGVPLEPEIQPDENELLRRMLHGVLNKDENVEREAREFLYGAAAQFFDPAPISDPAMIRAVVRRETLGDLVAAILPATLDPEKETTLDPIELRIIRLALTEAGYLPAEH